MPCRSGSCTPTSCKFDGVPYTNGQEDPDTPCQVCQPTHLPASWTNWTNRPDNAVCGELDFTDCINEPRVCVAGACDETPAPDGAYCGKDRVCCQHLCCEPGFFCSTELGCVSAPIDDGGDDDGDEQPCEGAECDGVCLIGIFSIAGGTHHETNFCLICDPSRNDSDWTPVLDGTACGPASDRRCCNGTCCPPGSCCTEAGLCDPAAC